MPEAVNRSMWRRVRPYVAARGWLLVVIGVSSLVSGFGEAAVLYLLLQAATTIASGDRRFDVELGPFDVHGVTVNEGAVAGAAIVVALVLVAVVRALATASVATSSLNEARKDLFRGFVEASTAMQFSIPEGHMQAALGGHTARIGTAVLAVATTVTASFTFLALMAAAIVLDPVAALVVLGAVGACGLVLIPLTRLTRKWGREMVQHSNVYAGLIAQSVRVIKEVRVFHVGRPLIDALAAESDHIERLGFRSRVLGRLTPQLYQYAALLLLTLGIGAASNVDGRDVASLGAIVVLLVRALTYGQQVAGSVQQVADSVPGLDVIDELREGFAANRMVSGTAPLPSVTCLVADSISFAYTPGVPVLRDVSFEIERGLYVGVVGPSGGGKSTLVQILLRLRDPDGGAYLVNGTPAPEYEASEFYRHFAFVPQDNLIVSGTVADNIRFYNHDLSDEAVERAARLAHLHEDIVRMPEGYDTKIGWAAQDLSGGQRQRLGLARALATEPSVLILDEPTAALDARSEDLVQSTLAGLRGELTLVVVAHRLSTLKLCDRLLVLENGAVAAYGDHSEVMRDSAFFREASHLQLRA